MKIGVGSLNPAKVAAVRSVVARVWPDVEVLAVDVHPGVSPMPLSDSECLKGARNRAQAALIEPGITLGIGLEGGVDEGAGGLMLLGWVVVRNTSGQEGIGGTARIPLPDHISKRIQDGRELGDVIDELMNEKDVKKKGGTIGALTSGLVIRQEAFAMATAFALSPFLAPELYK